MAGGDGRVSSAIGPGWQAGKTLAVLPAGTMNLFARSLALPFDLHGAVEEIAHGKTMCLDVATVGQAQITLHSKALSVIVPRQ